MLTVESAFRTLKTTLELRPLYHHKDERIRSHVLLCWLALLLVRMVGIKPAGHGWTSARSRMQAMHKMTRRTLERLVMQRTETTDVQREILSALRIALFSLIRRDMDCDLLLNFIATKL
nr:hypothetical protein [Alicyclobacillus kakegawensis]